MFEHTIHSKEASGPGSDAFLLSKTFSLLEESTRQRHLFDAEDLTTRHFKSYENMRQNE